MSKKKLKALYVELVNELSAHIEQLVMSIWKSSDVPSQWERLRFGWMDEFDSKEFAIEFLSTHPITGYELNYLRSWIISQVHSRYKRIDPVLFSKLRYEYASHCVSSGPVTLTIDDVDWLGYPISDDYRVIHSDSQVSKELHN